MPLSSGDHEFQISTITGEESEKKSPPPIVGTKSNESNEMDLETNHEDDRVSTELPFLVTHWLAGYNPPHQQQHQANNDENDNDDERKAATRKIHRLAADLASAFATLSAFGSSVVQSPLDQSFRSSLNVSSSSGLSRPSSCGRTFTDLRRQWSSGCPPEQLEILVKAAQSASRAVDIAVGQHESEVENTNLVMAAAESVVASIHNPKTGRTLQDAIDISVKADGADAESDHRLNATHASSFHPPVLILNRIEEDTKRKAPNLSGNNITVLSSYGEVATKAAAAVRHFLDARNQFEKDDAQIRSLTRSLDFNRKSLARFIQQRNVLLATESAQSLVQSNGNTPQQAIDLSKSISTQHVPANNLSSSSILAELDEIDSGEQNSKRVIAQLERQLPGLLAAQTENSKKVNAARKEATLLFNESKRVFSSFRDPMLIAKGIGRPCDNRLLFNLQSRQLGCVDRVNGRTMPRSMGRVRPRGIIAENQKCLLYHRFSYAATINSHLHYPVYCLRFDITGRYFITGADDYLVRVFCLGENVVGKKRRLDPSTYIRGAVLVCTLKGHAGVVNDICVSSDNSFLATASEDGDCRVWGLRDGCPVAILRGHHGGANMVSWSTLTPYRLVTTGADGLARIWDIREACLKRNGDVIGKRPEYLLKIKGKAIDAITKPNSDSVSIASRAEREGNNPTTASPASVIPTDEVQRSTAETETSLQQLAQGVISASPSPPVVPLPPLPPAPRMDRRSHDDSGSEEFDANVNANEGQLGLFVANDLIDEGVKIVSKLQHGASLDERALAPGTRARRSAVKVICVARCPYGGHFATGSDDGVCRVWRDDDDFLVEKVDAVLCGRQVSTALHKQTTRKSADPLLLVLKGHLSAITDLVYSTAGDRILTASQKDGMVRIWSWTQDPCSTTKLSGPGSPARRTPGGTVSHILLKLTNPRSIPSPSTISGPRRRINRTTNSNISCDVATWLHDDSKIVTSQSELVKANGSEIVPGSHYFFLWDSFTGHCLLGIAGAHSMQCPVLISHPTNSSIMCSAGADGVVNLWDWETGKCLFSHSNTATFGPLETHQIGKNLGFLDGSFSPDGTTLLLTDDSGRISIFDCNSSHKSNESSTMKAAYPEWMREQYFSNDYYDLAYDETGYCVERGSEQPPHIAPRGSRCSHTGAPVQEQVNEAFLNISGPIPCAEEMSRWNREEIRKKAEALTESVRGVKGNIVSQYDPLTTILIQNGDLKITSTSVPVQPDVVGPSLPSRAFSSHNSTNIRTVSSLSDTYRWGDAYADAIRAGEEEPDLESDDEEFQLDERRVQGAEETPSTAQNDLDANDLMRDTDDESYPPNSRQQASGPGSGAPSRISSRRRRRLYEDEDSDEGDLDEFTSTNNSPSGPFVADYKTYFFKLPCRTQVPRSWVRRKESKSSYEGRKKYTPQIGDRVVYIPRAHFDTIHNFPTLRAPWQNWPADAVWPVVECLVRNVRYRFPLQAYWNQDVTGQRCRSIVAILTLEIVGIPELCDEKLFTWPKPSFIEPAKGHVFELSLFENRFVDYVVPSMLYITRLSQLESSVSFADQDNRPKIEAFYAAQDGPDDAQFDAFPGVLVGLEHGSDDAVDPNLKGSGYDSVVVAWDGEEEGKTDTVHPWEIAITQGRNGLQTQRPSLQEDEKQQIQNAVRSVRNLDVNSCFLHPVDATRYSDYEMRVEVPMDLTFIIDRLDSDYYSTKFSAVADMRLILDNCIKYNGEYDDLTALARTMLEHFEESVLTSDERKTFHDYDNPVASGSQLSADPIHLDTASTIRSQNTDGVHRRPGPRRRTSDNGRSATIQRTRGDSRRRTASLAPASFPAQPGARRQNRSSNINQSEAGQAVVQRREPQTLEHLSSQSRRSARGRATLSGPDVISLRASRAQINVRSNAAQGSGHAANRNERQARRSMTQTESSGNRRRLSRFAPSQPTRQNNQGSSVDRAFSGRRSNRHSGRSGLESTSNPRLRSPLLGTGSFESNESGSEPIAGTISQRNLRRRPQLSRSLTDSRLRNRNIGSHFPEDSLADVSLNEDGMSDADAGSTGSRSDVNKKARSVARGATLRSAAKKSENSSDSDDQKPRARPLRRCVQIVASNDNDVDSSADDSNDSAKVVAHPQKKRVRRNVSQEESTGERRRSARKKQKTRDSDDSEPENNTSSGSDSQDSESADGVSAPPLDDESSESSSNSSDSSPRKAKLRIQVSLRGKQSEDKSRNAKKTPPSRNARKKGNSDDDLLHSPVRKPRTTTSAHKSYIDPSSSEFDSRLSESSDESDEASPQQRRRGTRPSNRQASPKKTVTKKKRAPSTHHEYDLPEVPFWPEINARVIPQVTKGVINRMKLMDPNEIFAVPVIETYPQHEEAYTKAIDLPMDFRTILEERIYEYESISELRYDLILTFENCIKFTGPRSDCGRCAKKLLQSMYDVFRDVCEEHYIRIQE